MFKNLLIVSFALIFSSITFAQNKSVYSELTTTNCIDATPPNSIGEIMSNGN